MLPVKLLSHLTIQANVEGYDVPIDLNSMAREIEVRPDHTTITYAHIALTLRQTMFAPEGGAEGTGAVVHFAGTGADTLRVPLPAIEVAIGHGLPLPGARTAQMKVLDEATDAHSLRLDLEGMAGSESVLQVRRNGATAHVQVDGAELISDTLHVHFPAGTGYVPQTVTMHW